MNKSSFYPRLKKKKLHIFLAYSLTLEAGATFLGFGPKMGPITGLTYLISHMYKEDNISVM